MCASVCKWACSQNVDDLVWQMHVTRVCVCVCLCVCVCVCKWRERCRSWEWLLPSHLRGIGRPSRGVVSRMPVELCMTSEQLGSLIPHDSQTSLLGSITLRSCYITKETLKFHHGAISWTLPPNPSTASFIFSAATQHSVRHVITAEANTVETPPLSFDGAFVWV